jgi:tripartite-type tricarboxylate transporter receptor subunit TctC
LGFVRVGPIRADARNCPAKDIHTVCNFPADSDADVVVRFFSEKLSTLTHTPVIVDNKGRRSAISTPRRRRSRGPTATPCQSRPGSSTMAAATSVFKKLRFDPSKDFIPVTTLAKLGFGIAVDAKSPIKTARRSGRTFSASRLKRIAAHAAIVLEARGRDVYLARTGLRL